MGKFMGYNGYFMQIFRVLQVIVILFGLAAIGSLIMGLTCGHLK